MENKQTTSGQCPVMHGGNTSTGKSNMAWWRVGEWYGLVVLRRGARRADDGTRQGLRTGVHVPGVEA